MLPKIIVGWQGTLEDFAAANGISMNKIIQIDGALALISDLRDWLNFSLNLTRTDNSYVILIVNADSLSQDSQNILLKPLEEKSPEINFYLLANKENGLLPTIISRCEVSVIPKKNTDGYHWPNLVKLWRLGPADILEFCEKVKQEELESLFSEVILRLRSELRKNVNQKRLDILNLFLESRLELDNKGMNKRLMLEDLLLRSWRVIAT